MLSSAGLPLLNGFIGEFTILQGAFEANRVWAYFAVTGVILGAAYLLWLYQRTMLGQVTNGKNLTISDMSPREIAIFLPLIAWAVWIGVYPKPYFDILQRPVAEIVERVRPGYYGNGVQNAGTGVGGWGAGVGGQQLPSIPAVYAASSGAPTHQPVTASSNAGLSSPVPNPQPPTPSTRGRQ